MAETDLITRPDEVAARALPSNVEAEAAFLGAALIDNRVIEELNTPLRPEHYFEPVHARTPGVAAFGSTKWHPPRGHGVRFNQMASPHPGSRRSVQAVRGARALFVGGAAGLAAVRLGTSIFSRAPVCGAPAFGSLRPPNASSVAPHLCRPAVRPTVQPSLAPRSTPRTRESYDHACFSK